MNLYQINLFEGFEIDHDEKIIKIVYDKLLNFGKGKDRKPYQMKVVKDLNLTIMSAYKLTDKEKKTTI